MQRQTRMLAVFTPLLLTLVADAGAGTISIGWDAVEHATGYRVYYGTTSRQYGSFVDVGNNTGALISGLNDCTTYFLSLKAYNANGESDDFSTEITGWSRPVIRPETTVALQGNQLVLELHGANFDGQANVAIDTSAIPIGAQGEALLAVGSFDVICCYSVQALVTVEPSAMGFQAMPTGPLPVGLQLENPDGVFNAGSIQLDVYFNPTRADLNRAKQRTIDRVDGDDLALLATVFGQCRSGSDWSEETCL